MKKQKFNALQIGLVVVILLALLLSFDKVAEPVANLVSYPVNKVTDLARTVLVVALGLFLISVGATAAAVAVGVALIVIGLALVVYAVYPWLSKSSMSTRQPGDL